MRNTVIRFKAHLLRVPFPLLLTSDTCLASIIYIHIMLKCCVEVSQKSKPRSFCTNFEHLQSCITVKPVRLHTFLHCTLVYE